MDDTQTDAYLLRLCLLGGTQLVDFVHILLRGAVVRVDELEVLLFLNRSVILQSLRQSYLSLEGRSETFNLGLPAGFALLRVNAGLLLSLTQTTLGLLELLQQLSSF